MSMDIFDKRDAILDKQEAMLSGKIPTDSDFMALVNFESWCANSGLSGYVQDIQEPALTVVCKFAENNDLDVVKKMMCVVEDYVEKYGKEFVDQLSDEQYEYLSQYDDEFYKMQDRYTELIYETYIKAS